MPRSDFANLGIKDCYVYRNIELLNSGRLVEIITTTDYRIRVIDLFSGKELANFPFVNRCEFSRRIIISRDYKFLLYSSWFNFYAIDIATSITLDTDIGTVGKITDMWLSDDSNRLYLIDEDEIDYCIDLQSGEKSYKFYGHPNVEPIKSCISVNSKETMQAIGDYEGNLWINNPDNMETTIILKTQLKQVNAVAFSPDDKKLACAGAGNIIIIDPITLENLSTFKTHEFADARLIFNKNSDILVSLLDDKILFWDLVSKKLMLTLVRPNENHDFFAFTPDWHYDCTEVAKPIFQAYLTEAHPLDASLDNCRFTPGLLKQLISEFDISKHGI